MVLAYTAAVAATMLVAVGSFFLVLNWPVPLTNPEWGFPGFQGALAFVLTVVGTVIAVNRPGNRVGRLQLVAGVLAAAQFCGHQYGIHGLFVDPGSLALANVAIWIEEWVWIPMLAAMASFTFLLFPTGRLPSPRWRTAGWTAAIGTAVAATAMALGPITRTPGVLHPLLLDGPPPFVDPFLLGGLALFAASLGVGVLSLGVRFRSSTGAERQQLKWLAFAALVVGAAVAVYLGAMVVTGDQDNPTSPFLALSVLAIPVAIGFAIQRYGLYEIDRLINRTVVYGLVSVVLVVLYAASVLVLQAALTWLTNGETFAVAASTLFVAAIFQPVRRRLQRAVDRRFNRARYDARRTVEEFGTRLRDEVDLSELRAELGAVVAETIQPTSVGIWLRPMQR